MRKFINPNSTEGLKLVARNWEQNAKYFKENYLWQSYQVSTNRKRLKTTHKEILLKENSEAYEELILKEEKS